MSDDALNFKLTATDLASKKIATVKTNLGGLATQAKSSILTGVGLGAGVVGFQLLETAVAGAVGILKDSVQAAIEDETSISALTAALKANVPLWDGSTAAIDRRIKKSEALGFSDDQIRASMASLVGATHDQTKALDIQSTAMDLARFKHISLQEATDALVKVEAGRYRILASLGIVLQKGATQAEAIAAVQRVAGGQAEAFGKTTAGAMEAARIAFDELKEDIGRNLMPVLLNLAQFARNNLIPAIRGIGDALGSIQKFRDQVGGGIASLGIDFGDMGNRVHAIADKFDRDFDTTKNHIKHYMLDMGMSFADAADRAEADLSGRIVNAARNGMGSISKVVREAKPEVTRAMDEVSADGVLNPLYHGFASAVAAASKLPGDIAGAIRDSRDNVKTQMDLLKNDITNSVSEATRQAKLNAMLLDPAIVEGMQSGDPLVKAQAEATRLAILNSMGVEDTFQWGWAVGKSWLKGLTAGVGDAVQRQGLANRLREYQAQLEGRSPPREGPLKNIDKGGFNIGKAWSSAFSAGLAGATIPSMPSLSMPGGMAMAGASGGGAAITINVNAPLGTPAAGQALARLLVPELTRELRRQRVL